MSRKGRFKRAFKEFVKNNKGKLIGYPIAAIIITILVLVAKHLGEQKKENPADFVIYHHDEDYKGGPLTLQNEYLTLEMNPNTTQFTLTDNEGNVWYSTSQASDSNHPEANALLKVVYQNKSGVPSPLNSYKESVEKKNYQVESDGKKITIDFTIGKIEKTYYYPQILTVEKYEELRGRLTSDDSKSAFRDRYIKMTPEKLARKENEDYGKNFPKAKDEVEKNGTTLYFVRSAVQDWQKEELQDYLANEAGYTMDEWKEDQEKFAQLTNTSTLPAIDVTMILELDGPDLVVTIPYEKISYRSTNPLTQLYVLPYMLSEPSTSDGYMFVPDGSGAIINFNNQKSSMQYSAKIFGWDYAMTQKEVVSDPVINYPVYGIAVNARTEEGEKKDHAQSLLAIIEEGEAYGYIKSVVTGGAGANVNAVQAVFDMVKNEQVDMGAQSDSDFFAYEESLPKGESIKMRFRSVNSSNYVDMAKEYREYYLKKYELAAQKTSGKLPTAVELIGAVTKTQHILGFPVDRPYAMTTYSEMADIIKELNDAGMNNLSVILNGWFNDGVQHDVANDVSLIGVLGGKSDFKKAISNIRGAGNDLYLKAGFVFVYDDDLFDGYRYRRDTAKYLSREYVKMQKISDVWYGIIEDSDYFYLANPAYIEKTMKDFSKEIADYDVKGIAFTDIGNKLASDYNRKKAVSRQAAMNGQIEVLSNLRSDDYKMIFYDAFDYVVKDADLLVDMDVDSTHMSLTDDSIPFFPIVLHGHVDYTGAAINVTGDYTYNLLNCVETGAGLYFVFMEKEGMELAESDCTKYFGANFDSWKDDAVALYKRFQNDFSKTYNQTIEDHQIIDTDVKMTQFADGTKVYVNYRTADYTLEDGLTIPAQSWVVR